MTANVVALRAQPAPKHLSPEAVRWWRSIVGEYCITDPAGLLLLQSACESFDRMKQAAAAIAEDGMVTKGSKQQRRAHPLLAVERDARAQMLAALKHLNLDLEPLRDRGGRPAGEFYNGVSHADKT